MTDSTNEVPEHVGGAIDSNTSAQNRDRDAAERDRRSDADDQRSDERDAAAQARDARADAREHDLEAAGRDAAADRAAAKDDRDNAATDRQRAHSDRRGAASDRAISAQERQTLLIDALTGTRRRDPGVMELEREITRAKRTHQAFVLAFVDVDGLKTINDEHGHTAGDELLAHVAATIRGRLRAYDLIVRYGGDEFLCGLLGLSLDDTVSRFETVNAVLAADHASITVGLAALTPNDVLQDLVERADAALYRERLRRTTPPS